MKYTIVLLAALFLAGCGTTKQIHVQNQIEKIYVPDNLYKCEQLLKKELPKDGVPAKNFDVHSIIDRLLSKNAECRGNIKAIKKIITDFNAKVDQLNNQKKAK